MFIYDFRLLAGQTVTAIERSIRKELNKTASRFRDFRFRTRVERDNPPLGGSRRSDLVRFAARILRRDGLKPVLVTKPSCTEAGIYERWGIPAVIFGPGEAAGNIHAPNERVSLLEVAQAARTYESLIRAACAGEKPCF